MDVSIIMHKISVDFSQSNKKEHVFTSVVVFWWKSDERSGTTFHIPNF